LRSGVLDDTRAAQNARAQHLRFHESLACNLRLGPISLHHERRCDVAARRTNRERFLVGRLGLRPAFQAGVGQRDVGKYLGAEVVEAEGR
jgi:hypothetical protein